MTLYASLLTEEMDQYSSSSKESSSGSRTSSSSSSSENSSGTLQEEFEMVLEAVAEVYNDIEGGMEDDTIEWQGQRVIVVDLSEDDAIFHF
jgi:hypothetical protein